MKGEKCARGITFLNFKRKKKNEVVVWYAMAVENEEHRPQSSSIVGQQLCQGEVVKKLNNNINAIMLLLPPTGALIHHQSLFYSKSWNATKRWHGKQLCTAKCRAGCRKTAHLISFTCYVGCVHVPSCVPCTNLLIYNCGAAVCVCVFGSLGEI